MIAEEPFGGPVVVGRGGIELHLRTTRTVEPLCEAEEERAGRTPPDGEPLVVVAETPEVPGRVVALAVGSVGAGTARLVDLVVTEAHRGEGIARQVLGWWCTGAGRLGATVAVAQVGPTGAASLGALGWTIIGDLAVRRVQAASE